MGGIADNARLVRNIVRLRRAERVPGAARDVVPVRRELERQLGPTLTRSMTARVLGVSPTALERWVAAGEIPTVLTPRGKREVPRRAVLDLAETIQELRAHGDVGRPLAAALRARRVTSGEVDSVLASIPETPAETPSGHRTAELRSLALHRIVAGRLDERIVEEARQRIEELAERGAMHPLYAERWRELLARPLERVAEAIAEDSQEGRDLRQNTPFAGVVSEEERRRVLAQVG